MTNRVEKRIKVAVLVVAMLMIGGYSLFRSALHAMEIEDRYGDLQHFYFRSQNGDLMVNLALRKVGVVRKTGRFMRILENKSKNKKEVDLYDWVCPHEQETKVAVYRVQGEGVNASNIGYDQLLHLIDNQQVELVVKN